jgi:excisionase family DNA binding protein
MPRSSRVAPNPATDPAPYLLTMEEACERFRLSRRFLTAAIEAGRLRAARFGRAVRLDVNDLRAFLEAAKVTRP